VRVVVEYRSAAGLCRETATTLGAGGLFIETDRPLPKGTTLKLAFEIPGSEVRHEIEGTVAWANRLENGATGSQGMGVAFADRLASARLARDLNQLED
jgi:type IV pilus assembly protein PilZ